MEKMGIDPYKGIEPGAFAREGATHRLHVNQRARVWEDAKGNLIPYDDMSDEYIEECIEWCNVQADSTLWLNTSVHLGLELKRRKKE